MDAYDKGKVPFSSYHIRVPDIRMTSLVILTLITWFGFLLFRITIFPFLPSIPWKQVTKSCPHSKEGELVELVFNEKNIENIQVNE